MKILIVLTQYKRNNLKEQLVSITNQTLKPDYLIVFQNENHINIQPLKDEYKFIHVKSDYNTKYFGRFSICFTYPVDICIVMDDDIIPGKNCIKNYVNECIRLNGIIGGNGRIAISNKNKNLKKPSDLGSRKNSILVDFVGHLWCFKKDWLYYMFAIKPYTYDTGEDMHLCFSAKLLGGISSYCCKQLNKDDECDLSNNIYAIDEHASWRYTKKEMRVSVEKYFLNKNLKLITYN